MEPADGSLRSCSPAVCSAENAAGSAGGGCSCSHEEERPRDRDECEEQKGRDRQEREEREEREGTDEWVDLLSMALCVEPQETRQPPVRLRRAETVLRQRTGRFLLVLEQCCDNVNQAAVLRTCESMGVQHVWVVRASATKHGAFSKLVHKGADAWLSLREFDSSAECLAELRAQGWEVWATSVSHSAVPFTRAHVSPSSVPPRLAVVMGSESAGVSDLMLAGASKHVFLPMFGFTESFNLSVATALVLHTLFDLCPQARGDLPECARGAIRERWFCSLARGEAQRQLYGQWLRAPGGVAPLPLEDLRPCERDKVVRVPKKWRRKPAAGRHRDAAIPPSQRVCMEQRIGKHED